MDIATYLVTEAAHSSGRSTAAVVEAALDGGVDVVQVREKAKSAREQLAIARELGPLTAAADTPLIVNDRVDVALAADADGVHVGDDDLPVAEARAILGPDAYVGRSVSTVEGARAAEEAGADYLGVGAVYRTDSKPDIDEEEQGIGLERVREIDEAVAVPLVAIGGITAENAAQVAAAGADGVAAISAITGADDPATATRELAEAVAAGRARTAADAGGQR